MLYAFTTSKKKKIVLSANIFIFLAHSQEMLAAQKDSVAQDLEKVKRSLEVEKNLRHADHEAAETILKVFA